MPGVDSLPAEPTLTLRACREDPAEVRPGTGGRALPESAARKALIRSVALSALLGSVAYLIWQKPLMVAGRATFIDEMLTRCGLENALASPAGGRYPQVTPGEIRAAALDAILLSSEPFPFGEKHRQAFETEFPGVPVHLVDGQMFSWYGSRLLLATDYLRGLLLALAE